MSKCKHGGSTVSRQAVTMSNMRSLARTAGGRAQLRQAAAGGLYATAARQALQRNPRGRTNRGRRTAQ